MRSISRRILRITAALAGVAGVALASGAAAAQQAPPSAGGTGAIVEVTVHDSVSGHPLGGALVQLVSRPDPMALSRSAETDATGRATFRDVPPGRYSVGFLHEALDALGIEAPLREVVVGGTGRQVVGLAVPSAARVRLAVCGAQAATDSSAAMIGTVREPRDRTVVAGAKVRAEWMELSFGTAGVVQRVQHITATTAPNGWFALCGLPSGTVMVTARQEHDSTDRLELQLAPNELLHRALFVAAPLRAGLRGRVVTADSARPLAGARVMVAGGAEAVTDSSGAWAMAGVPVGTRMLEVRAVGYYPARVPVDVVADAPPQRVALSTFQAVLSAVRVTATRQSPADAGGFAERQRRSGLGRFYTPERIANLNPTFTSDLLRTLPGFTGDGSLTMKGNFSDGAGNFGVDCVPEVYIDGHLLRGISAPELDGLVEPENIAGMEVYSTGSPRPPQFNSGMTGCGALVIWQKLPAERVKRRR
ncbi:MAG TPA: carboxypeptidase regulatory-like domain-containing protein [Gemmatimonadaceae bacterium]